ncbi:hypothetical protein [Mesorhizobium sp.]|uniref:hypothetical protein n=1 Tax=Mesorhizobium sp. TaxID=1871066 RepID=UPI0025ECE378|nr:hypothetical protein [Mesorhizobium sp.]
MAASRAACQGSSVTCCNSSACRSTIAIATKRYRGTQWANSHANGIATLTAGTTSGYGAKDWTAAGNHQVVVDDKWIR